eukprot:s1104_g3.t1
MLSALDRSSGSRLAPDTGADLDPPEAALQECQFHLFGDEIPLVPKPGFQNKVQELLRVYPAYHSEGLRRPNLQTSISCQLSSNRRNFARTPTTCTEPGNRELELDAGPRRQRSESMYIRKPAFIDAEKWDGSYGMLSRDPDDSRVDNNAKTYSDACRTMRYGLTSFAYSLHADNTTLTPQSTTCLDVGDCCPMPASRHCVNAGHHGEAAGDWDDTLFPTTWLESKQAFQAWCRSGAWRSEASPHLDAKDDMEQAARAIVATASDLGHVCCVTLAQPPWQEVSMKATDLEETDSRRYGSSAPAARAIVKDVNEQDDLFKQQQMQKKMKAMDTCQQKGA